MPNLRLLIADDHQLVRDGLKALIASQNGDIEIVGEASNGREAVKLTRQLKPDIVLMDISMPELNGIEAVKQLTLEQPDCRVIALSMHQTRDYVTQMLGAGAKGYLNKTAAFNELNEAVQTVAQGNVYLGKMIADVLVDDYQRLKASSDTSTDPTLSPREREVLQLVAEGYRSAAIAEKLNVSIKTVEAHRSQIVRKLQLHGVAEMTKYAIQKGIITL